jgi:hypothetical protein
MINAKMPAHPTAKPLFFLLWPSLTSLRQLPLRLMKIIKNRELWSHRCPTQITHAYYEPPLSLFVFLLSYLGPDAQSKKDISFLLSRDILTMLMLMTMLMTEE